MLYPLILTSLAGMSTLIGLIPIFIKIKDKIYLVLAIILHNIYEEYSCYVLQ